MQDFEVTKDTSKDSPINEAHISGVITTEPVFSHELLGENFYTFHIRVKRQSDVFDDMQVMVSDRITDMREYAIGRVIEINGQFRSYNQVSEQGKSHLVLNIFAQDINFLENALDEDINSITLSGFVCKEPTYRVTPKGREIADIITAVNRQYNKSDYIPCICWGRNARYASKMMVGTRVTIQGRMQSRTYEKKFPDGTSITRVAYEVSVSGISEIKEQTNG